MSSPTPSRYGEILLPEGAVAPPLPPTVWFIHELTNTCPGGCSHPILIDNYANAWLVGELRINPITDIPLSALTPLSEHLIDDIKSLGPRFPLTPGQDLQIQAEAISNLLLQPYRSQARLERRLARLEATLDYLLAEADDN
jgi:hypothetical protein